MKPITLVTVNAGLGSPSSSRMLAEAIAERFGDVLTDRNIAYSVTHIDLREYATAIANNFVTGFAEGPLQKVLDEVQSADALVVVTPVFNASFSGLFKSFFDLIDSTALESKPVVLGAAGGSERHSLVLEHALRPLFSYLKAQPVSTAVFAATADWGTNDDVAKQLQGRSGRAATELADQVQLRTVPAVNKGGAVNWPPIRVNLLTLPGLAKKRSLLSTMRLPRSWNDSHQRT